MHVHRVVIDRIYKSTLLYDEVIDPVLFCLNGACDTNRAASDYDDAEMLYFQCKLFKNLFAPAATSPHRKLQS